LSFPTKDWADNLPNSNITRREKSKYFIRKF